MVGDEGTLADEQSLTEIPKINERFSTALLLVLLELNSGGDPEPLLKLGQKSFWVTGYSYTVFNWLRFYLSKIQRTSTNNNRLCESGGTVRSARCKDDSPRASNTHTIETTMPPGLHGSLAHFKSHSDYRDFENSSMRSRPVLITSKLVA